MKDRLDVFQADGGERPPDRHAFGRGARSDQPLWPRGRARSFASSARALINQEESRARDSFRRSAGSCNEDQSLVRRTAGSTESPVVSQAL
jgi:hypothetical protein